MSNSLTATLRNARKLTEHNPNQPETSIVRIDCQLRGESIYVGIGIRVPVSNSTEDVASVAATARKSLPKLLASKPDIFKELTVNITGEDSDGAEYETPIEFTIDDATYESLKSQAAHYAAVQSCFDDSIRKLRKYARMEVGGVHSRQSEILTLLAYVDRCIETGGYGQLYNWYESKRSAVRSRFEDLFSRKQGNHPSFTASQEYIADTL